eukprot:gene10639-biopygen16803
MLDVVPPGTPVPAASLFTNTHNFAEHLLREAVAGVRWRHAVRHSTPVAGILWTVGGTAGVVLVRSVH